MSGPYYDTLGTRLLDAAVDRLMHGAPEPEEDLLRIDIEQGRMRLGAQMAPMSAAAFDRVVARMVEQGKQYMRGVVNSTPPLPTPPLPTPHLADLLTLDPAGTTIYDLPSG